MGTWRWNVGLALAVVAGVATAGGRGDAVATAGPTDAAAVAKARTASLTARLREWCEARKRLVRVDCPKCRGWGRVEDRSGRIATCPRCDGAKLMLGTDAYRKVHYDFKSPAFRGRDGATDEANAAYTAANGAGRAPGFLNAYRIDRLELVGVNGGSAWVFEGTDSVSRESRWLWLPEATTKKPQWFVYSLETDGDWPPPDPAPPIPEGPLPKREPITADELKLLRQGVADAHLPHHVESGRREDGQVVVAAFDGAAADAGALDAGIDRAVFALTREAFAALPDAKAVRVEFLARWRDRFGSVTKRPYRTSSIARGHFERIVPGRLAPAELLALFDLRETIPEDEVMWWKD